MRVFVILIVENSRKGISGVSRRINSGLISSGSPGGLVTGDLPGVLLSVAIEEIHSSGAETASWPWPIFEHLESRPIIWGTGVAMSATVELACGSNYY